MCTASHYLRPEVHVCHFQGLVLIILGGGIRPLYLSRDEALEYTEHGVRLLLFLSVRLGAVSFLNSLRCVIIPLFCREVYPQVLLDQALVHLVMKPT